MTDFTDKFEKEDIKEASSGLLLSYIGFLFIIPLIAKKNSQYAKFHVNQGICLFCLEIVLWVVQLIVRNIFISFLPEPIMVILNFILAVMWILALSLGVKGIVNVNAGRGVQLPLIGKFEFFKMNFGGKA